MYLGDRKKKIKKKETAPKKVKYTCLCRPFATCP